MCLLSVSLSLTQFCGGLFSPSQHLLVVPLCVCVHLVLCVCLFEWVSAWAVSLQHFGWIYGGYLRILPPTLSLSPCVCVCVWSFGLWGNYGTFLPKLEQVRGRCLRNSLSLSLSFPPFLSFSLPFYPYFLLPMASFCVPSLVRAHTHCEHMHSGCLRVGQQSCTLLNNNLTLNIPYLRLQPFHIDCNLLTAIPNNADSGKVDAPSL